MRHLRQGSGAQGEPAFTPEQEQRIRELAEIVPLHMRPPAQRNGFDKVVRLTRWVAILCTVSAVAQIAGLVLKGLGS